MKENFINISKILIFLLCFSILSCSKQQKNPQIAVFIPGIRADSPVYDMLASGLEKAIFEYNATNKQCYQLIIIEAGTTQSQWPEKLTALSASGKYSVIFSSNPSLPDIVEPLTKQFPKQKFILLDAYKQGNPSIYTVQYNQREQAYLNGFIAGLATTSNKLPLANPQKKIALIAAQEYPVMNNIILPGFIEGAKAIDKDIDVEFRIVGSWSDAIKSNDIAQNLYSSGVDVILPICGGASQGIITAAKELGFYITWFDNDGTQKAPENIICSGIMKQEQMAYELATAFLYDKLEFGKAQTVGITDGYIDTILNSELLDKSEDNTATDSIVTSLEKVKKLILNNELDLSVKE